VAAAIDRYLPQAGTQQQTRRRPLLLPIDDETDKQSDGRTPHRYIVPAAHILCAMPVNNRWTFSFGRTTAVVIMIVFISSRHGSEHN